MSIILALLPWLVYALIFLALKKHLPLLRNCDQVGGMA